MYDITKIIPVIKWLPNYTIEYSLCDLMAGITVGLTLIPQSMAYAALAGLNPEHGLYSSLTGGIVYAIFGTIPQINLAPTALLSLLTLTYTGGSLSSAILLCFTSGIVQILCGLLHLGFLINFVSMPVVVGFQSAAALTIASAQLKTMLGLKFNANGLIMTLYNIVVNYDDISEPDGFLSLACCLIILSMKELGRLGSPPSKKRTWKTIIWFISVSRNALVVLLTGFIAYYFNYSFALNSHVPEGLPAFNVPYNFTNATFTSFTESLHEISSGLIVIPLIGILSNVTIAKAFSNGKAIDASQEMLALGVNNLLSAFFGAYPTSASFSRGALGNSCGVRTPLIGIYTSAMVVMALTFLTPYFTYIPRATLASVIFCAVIFLIELRLTVKIWRNNKANFIVLAITFVACLVLSIDLGILVGILCDSILLLYFTSRPPIDIIKVRNDNSPKYLRITLTGALLYSSSEYIRENVLKHVVKQPEYKVIVFDCSKLSKIDFTAIQVLQSLFVDLKSHKLQICCVSLGDKYIQHLAHIDIVHVDNDDSLQIFTDV